MQLNSLKLSITYCCLLDSLQVNFHDTLATDVILEILLHEHRLTVILKRRSVAVSRSRCTFVNKKLSGMEVS